MRFAFAAASLWLLACSSDPNPLAQWAEQVRELSFFDDVDIVEMSREEYAAQAAEDAANIDQQRLFELGQTYGRLGYFPIDLDLVPIIAGSNSDWVGASYSPSSKMITLVGEARSDTLVHELVHALQDQHFDITAYDVYETSDGFLARRAVVEGDATLAQYRFIMEQQYGTDLHELNWPSAFDNLRQFSEDLLLEGTYPSVFLDYPTFCYPYGLEYDAYNLTGVRYGNSAIGPFPYDWGLEDELFTDRPANSTQQVLRLRVNETDPVAGLEFGVPAALAERFSIFNTDVLGEWYAYLLFFNAADDIPASRLLASNWDADRALFLQDLDTDELAVVWASRWHDATAAAEVVDTMWTIHGRTVGTFEPERFATADDGEPVWIEQRDDMVVFIKNAPQDLMAQLAEEAFAPTAQPRLVRRTPSLAQFVAERPHLSH